MRYEVQQIAGGWAGTVQTVDRIGRLVNQSLTDPVVVQTARDIVRFVPERDREAEIRAVSNFVRSKIRYTYETVETISTPRFLLDEIRKYGRATGDCDDFVTLWLALLRVLGHKVRVQTVSQRPDRLANHIYGEVWSPRRRRWIADDTIVKRKPMGWSIPRRKITKSRMFNMSGVSGMGDVGKCGGRSMMSDWVQVGRTAVVSADSLSPRKRAMMSHSLAPTGAKMKRPGMLWVGPGGRLGAISHGNGLGQWAEAISSAAQAIIPAAVEAYKVYKDRKKRPKIVLPTIPGLPPMAPVPVPPPRPTPPPEKKDNTILYVALGVAAIFLLRGRRR